MHVHISKRKRNSQRGIKRWLINTTKEKSAGLLPRSEYVRDDTNVAFTTLAAAEAFAEILRERIAGGATGAQDKTFGDAVEAWEDDLDAKSIGETTRKDDIAQVRNHIIGKWTLRGVPIERVRLATINHSLLKAELKKRGGQIDRASLQRPGKIKLLQKFRAIFDIAVDERWIATSPATRIALDTKVEDLADKAIDPAVFGRFKDDVPNLLAALEIIDHDSVLPITTLLRTGIRSGELLALSLDQVTTTNQKTKLKINRAWKKDRVIDKPKSGKTRLAIADVELGVALKTHALQNQRRGDDLLFGDGVQVLDRAGLRLRWHQAQFAIRGW